VPGRRVHAAGERLDVQRLRVLPVDPVADALRSGGRLRRRRLVSITNRGETPRAGRTVAQVWRRVVADQPYAGAGNQPGKGDV